MRKCSLCKQEKELKYFSFKSIEKQTKQHHCKECHKIYRKYHYEINKQKYIDKAKKNTDKYKNWYIEYKKQFSCIDCGNNNSIVIEFHHEENNKLHNVSSMVGHNSKKDIIAEINKCVPLCANCHRIRHWYKNKKNRTQENDSPIL